MKDIRNNDVIFNFLDKYITIGIQIQGDVCVKFLYIINIQSTR